MSGSHSIFLKICPACAAQVPTAAERCDCGHDFESTMDGSIAPEETALRDEELYENYLLARCEQAHQAAESARLVAVEHADDANLAAEADLAREVARSIDTDLAEQRKKIEGLRRLIEVKRPKPVIVKTAPVPPVAAATPQAESTPKVPKPVVSAPAIEVTKTSAVEIVAIPAEPVKAETPTVTPAATSSAASAEKAAQVLKAIKRAKKREDVTRARKAKALEAKQQAVPIKVPEPAPQTPPAIEISANAPDHFRQEQAARADLVMETRKREDRKECPNCTASVPLNTSRCSCGFTFIAGGSDLPSLTLCTGDFTALRNSLNLHLRRS